MQYRTSYTIRFNDCDPYSHLHNSRYLDYMFNAREDHMRQHHKIDLEGSAKQGLAWVIRSNEILYTKPASYGEEICIESNLLQLGDTDLLVEMIMYNKECTEIKSLLWTTFISINFKSGLKESHSSDFKAKLEKDVIPEVDLNSGIRNRFKILSQKKQ